MYIKGIKLRGFKSYKEETTISELYNGLNIIVGRNGSGKSNIFSAIEFALTLEFNRYMKPEARNSIVYNGQTTPEGSYVEIIFDNTNRKLPVNDDTVIFRRTFSTKKDRFCVNGKELANAKQFLDAAGFTNPYFIVKQGKIHDLALATDAARLKVISDATGVNAYDVKILDCRRTIEAADSKKGDIENKIIELRERQSSLEEEVTGQKRFMKMDQTKRAIEYILHKRKTEEIELNISKLEESRLEINLRQKPAGKELEKVERDIQLIKRDICESEMQIKRLHYLKNEYDMSKNKYTNDVALLNQELRDLESKEAAFSEDRQNVTEMATEIAHYETLLVKADAELLISKETVDDLYFRKCQLNSRVHQYHETELIKGTEASKHVQTKQDDIKKRLENARESLNISLDAQKDLENNLKQEEMYLQNHRENFTEFGEHLNTISHTSRDCKAREATINTRLEVLLRDSSENEQILSQKWDRLTRLDDDWKKLVGAAVYEGWKGVNKIVNDFKSAGTYTDVVNGYYGLVCEFVLCDPKLDTAIEVAAGKNLVQHVVQSKAVAEVILREFNARKLRGEISFLPIDSLKSSNVFKLGDCQGAVLLSSLIELEDKFKSVSEFVFGKTLLCESFEAATEKMRAHKIQCVTMEGDKVSKVGVMTGGYKSKRPQKLEIQRARNKERNEVMALTDKKQSIDNESIKLKQEYESLRHRHEKCSLQKAQTLEKRRRVTIDIETAEKKVRAMKESLKSLRENITDCKATISILQEQIKSDGNNNDNENDKMKVVKLLREVINQYGVAEKDYNMKQMERNALDVKLNNLRKIYYNRVQASASNSHGANQMDTSRISELIKSLSMRLTEIQNKIDVTTKEAATLQKTIMAKHKQVDVLTHQENKAKEMLRRIFDELDSFSTNHAHWLKKLEIHKTEGNALGSLPASLEDLEKSSDSVLFRKLKKLNSKLKDSVKVGINQKAIQQYDELKEKCDAFDNRMKTYIEDRKRLTEFLKDLRARKGQAMLQNVRLIQDEFRKIFCEIVPHGNAELEFYGNGVSINHERNIDEDALREAAGDNLFEGVRVQVNFIGKQLHVTRGLAQLSGGQKSVIALCLILAIQNIDPAPFYLLDEVDQALDAAYRDAVAKVIGIMSERSQFVCTTFRKELVAVADKIFGVSFENRCSHIKNITEEQALSFVENEYSPMDSSSISPNGSFCHSNVAA